MARGKGQPKGQNRPRNRLQQRATSNVQLQDQGQVDLLNQQFQQAQQDFQRERQAGRSIWGGYQNTLKNVPRPDFQGIGQDYNTELASVAPMFGGDEYMPGAEIGAGQDLGLAYGEAGNTMLANLAAREGMARSSAGREGAVAARSGQENLLQRFQDTMQGYNNQLGQVRADDPWQTQQEASRLKEQQITQQLAQARMKSDAATAAFLEQYYGSMIGGNNRRPGGNQGPTGSVRPRQRPHPGAYGGYPAPESWGPVGPTGSIGPTSTSGGYTGAPASVQSPGTNWDATVYPPEYTGSAAFGGYEGPYLPDGNVNPNWPGWGTGGVQ